MRFTIPEKCCAAVCLAGLLISTTKVQGQGPTSNQAGATPTIRVNTRLVLVDVVVKDKKGNAITGLKAEDFSVQEKGKTQKIAFLTTPGEAEKQAASELPPGIYSNRPEYRSPGGPLTILLIDAANTPFKDQAYARQQMLQFIKQQYKPGQRMAVMTLTNSLGVLQDFTTDPQVLLKALDEYKPREQEMTKAGSPPALVNSDSVRGTTAIGAGVNQELRAFQTIQLAYVM